MDKTLRQKVFDGLLWSAARSWGAKFVTLGLFIAMSRLLGPHEFGVFAAAVSVLAFVQLFVDQGLAEAIVQRREIAHPQLNSVFVLNLAASLLLVGVLWVAAPYIAFKVDTAELTDVLRVASLAIPLTALGLVQSAMNRRQFRFKTLAVLTLVATVVSGAVALALALQGLGAWSLVAQFVVQAGVATLLLWRSPLWKPTLAFDGRGLQQLMSYGVHRLGSNLLHYGNTKYVELYLAATLGVHTLGVYLVGVKVYESLLQMLNGAVAEVAHSGFSRLAGDMSRLRAAYYQTLRTTSAIGVPVFVLLAILAEPVTAVVFGAKWLDSAPVLRAMSLLGAVQILQFYNGTVYNALGKPQIGLWFAIFKLSVTLPTLWLLAGRPLEQLVVGYVIVQALTAIPSFYLVRRVAGVGLRDVWTAIKPYALACATSAAATAWALHGLAASGHGEPAKLLGAGSVGVATYLFTVACVARHDLAAVRLRLRKLRSRPN